MRIADWVGAGCAAFCMAATSGAVLAQDISQSITRTADAFTASRSVRAMEAQALEPAQDLTLGFGYQWLTHAGRRLDLPVSYGFTAADGRWGFRIDGGYSDVRVNGEGSRGSQDVSLLANAPLTSGKFGPSGQWVLVGAIGLGLPAHGKVGTDDYSQQVRLIAVGETPDWRGIVAGGYVHVNGQQDGVGGRVAALHLELRRSLDSRKFYAKFDRVHVEGIGGTSRVTVQGDQSLPEPSWTASASIQRGLARKTANPRVDIFLTKLF